MRLVSLLSLLFVLVLGALLGSGAAHGRAAGGASSWAHGVGCAADGPSWDVAPSAPSCAPVELEERTSAEDNGSDRDDGDEGEGEVVAPTWSATVVPAAAARAPCAAAAAVAARAGHARSREHPPRA